MREAVYLQNGGSNSNIEEVMDDSLSENAENSEHGNSVEVANSEDGSSEEIANVTENDSVAGPIRMTKPEFGNSAAGKKQSKYNAYTIHGQSKRHCILANMRIQEARRKDDNILLISSYVEQCPRTQRWHIQGYVALKKKRRLSSIFTSILCVWEDDTIWPYVKPAIYSAWHNKRYCEKKGANTDGFTEGEAANWTEEQLKKLGAKQGKRSDIEAMAKDFKENPWETKLTKARKFPNQFCHYNRAFDKLLTLERDHQYHAEYDNSERAKNQKNYAYVGPPGSGKSHTVAEEVKKLIADNPHLRVYYKTIQKWWDGYDGEEIVVIDDFRSGMKFSELLNLMDGKPFRREAKGTSICLRAHHIFFTAPKHPRYWYQKLMEEDGDAEGQLLRRIYQLREFTPEDNPHYNRLVRSRIRKRNRMGFIIEDSDGSGRAPLAPLRRMRNVMVSRAKRPRTTTTTTNRVRVQGDGFGGHSLSQNEEECLLCRTGFACYIHGNNLSDDGAYSQEISDILR